jgi:hypothetical protein
MTFWRFPERVSNNEAPMLATGCGSGRVFLIGVHPEIEEDSDSDTVMAFSQK